MKPALRFLCRAVILGGLLLGKSLAFALEWETLDDCRFINAGGNEGDVFHVQHDGKAHKFRLYFVEAPETSAGNAGKLKEQSAYFHTSEEEVVRIGKESAAFTLKFLAGRTFTVRTCWEEVKGTGPSSAYYALVEKDSRSLVEALIEGGLVQIRGTGISEKDSPLHISPDRYLTKLKRLEDDAKRDRLGAWSQSSETAPAVAIAPTPAPAPAQTVSAVPAAPPAFTVNINTASQTEIEQIPGVGPVLAKRIIQRRPYAGLEDIQKVQGIGPKTAEKITPFIRVKD